MTRSEALVAAAFRGFAEALVAAEGEKPSKKRESGPAVVPVDVVRQAVQEALPGLLQQFADEAEVSQAELDRPFGLGNIEEDETLARRQGPVGSFDANMPGTGGWSAAPE